MGSEEQFVDEMRHKRHNSGNYPGDLGNPEILAFVEGLQQTLTGCADMMRITEKRIGLLARGIGSARGIVQIAWMKSAYLNKLGGRHVVLDLLTARNCRRGIGKAYT